MRGLKRHYPDVRFSGNQVTPDELDRYEVYQVINPSISATHFGSATAGTVSQSVTVGLGNTVADYPRNVALVFSGSASVSGTATITGQDQFGGTLTETIGQAQGTQQAATVAGTSIFATVGGCTVTMGTGVVGTGTVSLGVPTAGSATLFGLPARIGGSTDVKSITWTDENGVSTPLNGGTIAGYVGTANHTFRGTEDLAGTMSYSVWFKPSYVPNTSGTLANL